MNAPYDVTAANLIDVATYAESGPLVRSLAKKANLSAEDRARICAVAADLVREIRESSDPGLMEVFLAEYGLSTDEGVALMCLAEALLRVPDAETMDDLIEDKIAPSNWGKHLGHSSSSLVNASTWALMLTGRVLDDEQPGIVGTLRGAVKRLGEPVIRTATSRAMREMGRQFVLGETIEKAMKRAEGMQKDGFTYSYDMLGEAAMTEADAKRYHLSYSKAISAIASHCTGDTVAENPGISVKLSALYPRYEVAHWDAVMTDLVPRVRSLAVIAKSAGMGFNIDAEEADRLSISLAVIEKVLEEEALAGWDGFGVVVQAYGKRAGQVIDHLNAIAERLDRKIMVRLVKGAYWDTEVKRAQVEGIDGFPVFTGKAQTDISYISNARKLLGLTDRIYPQFATHNAHTVAAVLDMAQTMGVSPDKYEFQRLHGMGEVLHRLVLQKNSTRCRIYAPVGAHRDLLAYLVRRLLENGANSSFVNQIVDEDVAPEVVAADPFDALEDEPNLRKGPALFEPERVNSKGFDLTHLPTLDQIEQGMAKFDATTWDNGTGVTLINPAKPDDTVGHVTPTSDAAVDAAIAAATPWTADAKTRATALNKAADLYEENFAEIFALLTREAGKSRPDAVAELREAVDFLRYYAAQAVANDPKPRGTWVCISPWNFPLAIFSGQIVAALAAGNAVLAKPAEQTPLIATFAVSLLHKAGVPATALQLLPGDGMVGARLTSSPQINGVAFTGSTETAQKINRAMAANAPAGTPLIAETGGLNAMIVDSTALHEAAVRDIINGAFRSAGQRCSALRCLYVQEDVAEPMIEMIKGAMDALQVGDPRDLATDVGPVIDATAKSGIDAHIAKAQAEGRVIHALNAPATGTFVAPTMIRINGIADLEREIFGPVLHVATFKASELDKVAEAINATGYGLTFGLHTRIDDRVEHLVETIEAGNIYVNRDQIGAIVGSQPFGGMGLSGTGPKAGGPNYLPRFAQPSERPSPETLDLPGPTGESNRLSYRARGPILCLGPDTDAQIQAVKAFGGDPITGDINTPASAVLWWGDADKARSYAKILADRDGAIVPLITGQPEATHVLHEVHVCIDTTAAGGNAALLADVSNS